MEKRLKGGRALKQIGEMGGGSGQMCPSLLPPPGKQRRGGGSPAAAWAGGSGRVGSHGVGEKREGRERGRSPAAARAEVDHGDSATVAGGGDRGGAIAELGGGSELGGKHEGALGIRFPRSPWAMAACGRLPTAAGGAPRLWWWRLRWRALGGMCGGGVSCGGSGRW